MARPNASRPAPDARTEGRSDRLVRLQIFLAFVVPMALVVSWLGSRGFFSAP